MNYNERKFLDGFCKLLFWSNLLKSSECHSFYQKILNEVNYFQLIFYFKYYIPFYIAKIFQTIICRHFTARSLSLPCQIIQHGHLFLVCVIVCLRPTNLLNSEFSYILNIIWRHSDNSVCSRSTHSSKTMLGQYCLHRLQFEKIGSKNFPNTGLYIQYLHNTGKKYLIIAFLIFWM